MIKKIVLKQKVLTEKKSRKSNVTKIEGNFTTPVLTIWKTTLIEPYTYKNGQSRYGIVAVLDQEIEEDIEFLNHLEALAVEHNVKSLGNQGKDGRIYIKFAGKEKPIIRMQDGDEEYEVLVESEFPAGVKGKITYDVNLYFNTREEGWLFNLFPKKFVFCPDKKSLKMLDVLDAESEPSNKNPRGRPRTKNNSVCKD